MVIGWLALPLCLSIIEQTISSSIIFHGAGHFEQLLLPYEIHSHSFCLRPYSLVVEPSPEFPHRSLAADYPLFHLHHFQTFTPTVSSYIVVDEALGSSSNSPSNPLICYQIRRPFNNHRKSCKTLCGNC